jgi:sterol 3beta-glucosyltransferase
MGTQALIQALQAMPWEDDRDEDISESAAKRERGKGRREPVSADSSDEDEGPTKAGEYSESSIGPCVLTVVLELDFVLASSIHTIHRPVARSRLATPAFGLNFDVHPNPPLEADYFSNPLSTDEDDGLRDFDEAATLEGVPNPFKEPPRMRLQLPADKLNKTDGKKRMPPPVRTASMATVRMKRRTKLAEKLKEVFGIPEIKEVVAGELWSLLRLWASYSLRQIQKCPAGSCVLSVSVSAAGKVWVLTLCVDQCCRDTCILPTPIFAFLLICLHER